MRLRNAEHLEKLHGRTRPRNCVDSQLLHDHIANECQTGENSISESALEKMCPMFELNSSNLGVVILDSYNTATADGSMSSYSFPVKRFNGERIHDSHLGENSLQDWLKILVQLFLKFYLFIKFYEKPIEHLYTSSSQSISSLERLEKSDASCDYEHLFSRKVETCSRICKNLIALGLTHDLGLANLELLIISVDHRHLRCSVHTIQESQRGNLGPACPQEGDTASACSKLDSSFHGDRIRWVEDGAAGQRLEHGQVLQGHLARSILSN